MSTLQRLFNKETVLRDRLDKFIENAKKTAIPKRTQAFYETRISDLKKLWEDYSAIDLELNESLVGQDSDESNTFLEEDNYSKSELKYAEYMSELVEGLRKHLPVIESQPNTSASMQSTTTIIQQESSLPRIALPTYNGDYDQWRSFRDMFLSLVHNNTRLKDVQKLHHLKTCLVGEAEKVLRHTPITNQDYMPAWNKLKERYENKRILVNHQLKALVNQPKQNLETSKGLKALIDTTEESLQQLKSLQVDTSSWDVLLIHLLVQKLPFITLKLWEEEQGATQELPSLSQFTTFLNKRLRILESITDALATNASQPRPIARQTRPTLKQTTLTCYTAKGGKCPVCNGNHFVQKCPKYLKMDIQARRKFMKMSGRCLNCFSKDHLVNKCSSKYTCFECKQRHHTTLHENFHKSQPTKSSKTQSNNISQTVSTSQDQTQHNNSTQDYNIHTRLQSADSTSGLNTTQTFVTRESHQALLSTALVMVSCERGKPIVLRCLIDSGSQSSLITETACKKLCATRTPTSVAIKGLNTSPATISHNQTRLKLRSCGSNSTTIQEDFLILKNITSALPTRVVSKRDYQHLNGLQLADPTFWKPGSIDALLGARIYAKILQAGIRRGSDTAPVAINTIFGWILLGSTNEAVNGQTESLTFTTTEVDLNTQLKRFWELEELPIQSMLSKREQDCESTYQTTVQLLKNGKYQVNLPFVDNEVPTLGQSRPQAFKRFMNLQKQFSRDSEFESEYKNCLNDYIERGHMEEVEPPRDGENHYYIPHHAVFKDSTTTKLTVVFDASARTTDGKSINDYLLKGPTLQPKLFATLLNWRKYKIAMNADIEKMYRMIDVHPDHRTFQRVIWQHPITTQIQDYQLKTVTFGTSSAPYLAVRTLQQLAVDESLNWPLASRVTLTDFYVDDILTGADNIPEAKELQIELLNMMKAGGFNLRKWASNEPKVLEDLPMDYREVKDTLNFSDNESIKTLGIRWHPAPDYFSFTIAPEKNTIITKRTILSKVASLYDPLGWLAPIIVVAKILMQMLWITGCSWDDPIANTIHTQWENFLRDLQHVESIRIPRWIQYSSNTNIQLHGFCDASERAYAAVLYLRVVNSDGSIIVNLLTAKSRVAPIKPTTIPRLELNGAVILARLIKVTVDDMKLQNIPVFAWTDSMIVLQWIKDHPSRWKSYVANRVVEIQDIIKYNQWQHVSTKDNPADLASRGSSAENLHKNNLWWHGPLWLRNHQNTWPKSKMDNNNQTKLEAKGEAPNSFFTNCEDDILLRYSSFTRLIRIVATLLRFKHNCRNPQNKRTDFFTSTEWSQASNTILKITQQSVFKDDYDHLLNNKLLPRSSCLLKLNPFLDKDGLIRVGGRLENADISYTRKHPIILPQHHHITSIIIDKLHKESLHGGPALVLSMSRNEYWILNARRCITSRIHKCITCARHRNLTSTQLMGNLPSSRVNITKPFTKVGIDYAGPIMVKVSTLRNAKRRKGYFCIFVCMATRAIHIELVSDLTAEAFLVALRRFVARRGLCTDIFSDCGTNFVGGKTILDKDLRQAIKEAEPEAAQYLASKTINWHFNPPATPHFGGIWEAGVKSIKQHLRRTLGNAICTFEEYATILTQIEACLNSRPLCQVHNDPDELFALTPGHFLIGQPLNAIPEPDYSKQRPSLLQRWKYHQQMVRQFWDRWSKDYLNQLQHRPKWSIKQTNIKNGDIVIIKNEHMSPTNWPLGIIEQVYPGTDGLVRVVQVRTRDNMLQRPITKICRLPIEIITQQGGDKQG